MSGFYHQNERDMAAGALAVAVLLAILASITAIVALAVCALGGMVAL